MPAQHEAAAEAAIAASNDMVVQSFTRKRPVRAPLPVHLPRERVVVPSPAARPCCGGKHAKLGEDTSHNRRLARDFERYANPLQPSSVSP